MHKYYEIWDAISQWNQWNKIKYVSSCSLEHKLSIDIRNILVKNIFLLHKLPIGKKSNYTVTILKRNISTKIDDKKMKYIPVCSSG